MLKRGFNSTDSVANGINQELMGDCEDNMRVKELIERLQVLNGELEVKLDQTGECGTSGIGEVLYRLKKEDAFFEYSQDQCVFIQSDDEVV